MLYAYILTRHSIGAVEVQKVSMDNSTTQEERQFEGQITGRQELWGARVFLLEASGGLQTLREQMTREIGPEFASDILYRTGFASAERFMASVVGTHDIVGTEEASEVRTTLTAAFALLTEAGYGIIRWDEARGRAGEIAVTVQGSVEGEALRELSGRAGTACDILRGLLRGIVQSLPPTMGFPTGLLECVEIQCIANDDPECRFVVATQEHLTRHGYRVGESVSSSVRETLLRLNRQLEDVLEAAQRDTLTGLYNRAHFESVLRNKIEYANRRTDTLAVAMIDMDGFKQVNDTQGHGMGDIALRQVGHLLASQARDTDTVARYGGDEFALLMPGTSVEAALAVADRIRRQLEELQEGMELPVSLSIGIAACPEDATSMAELIDLADTAMYLAKESGGNRVKHYVAADDSRGTTQKRLRKPRTRPVASVQALPEKSSRVPLDFPD